MKTTKLKITKWLLICLLASLGGLILHPHHASAGSISDYISEVAPRYIGDYVENACTPQADGGYGFTVVASQWISPANDPTSTKARVPFGASGVLLQLNYVTYRCTDSAVDYATFRIDSTTPNIPELIGLQQSLPSFGAVGHRNSGVISTFNYTNGAPFENTQDVTITTTSRGTRTFQNVAPYYGHSYCSLWKPGDHDDQTGGPFDFGPCDNGLSHFKLTFEVGEPQIQAHVFSVDKNGDHLTHLAGVQLNTCDWGQFTTGDGTNKYIKKGYAYFPVPKDKGFCVRVTDSGTGTGNSTIAGYDGPFVRPWFTGYFAGDVPSPHTDWNSANGTLCTRPTATDHQNDPPQGFGDPPDFPYTNHCANPSYEHQVAGAEAGYQTFFAAGTFFDRNWDGGYDFVYVKRTAQPNPIQCFANPSQINVNDKTLFSASPIFDESGNQINYTWLSPGGIPPSSNNVPLNPYQVQYNTIGKYTTTVTARGQQATCSVRVIKPPTYPYLRVFNGDVIAGGGIESSGTCGFTAGAGILAFDNTSLAGAGAGTQLAAYALNAIHGFNSSAGRSSPPLIPIPNSGLSFANTSPQANPPLKYGGGFGTVACTPDFFSKAKPLGTDLSLGNPSSITLPDTSINSTIIKYHDFGATGGKLIIGNNVTFTGASAGWANTQSIPQFYIVIKNGDIYIDQSVIQLDGVYIAQGGNIYTCTNASSLYPDGIAVANNCTKQLTVNGVFIADSVRLLRTKGDIASSTNGEANPNPNIAEIFNYTPEIFLNSPFNISTPYDSITNLPPIL